MPFTVHERTVLRECARAIADIAATPRMEQARRHWVEHNSLRRTRPLILVYPEGGWRELLADQDIHCEQPDARKLEWKLRSIIYTAEHFASDNVVIGDWHVGPVLRSSGWGLEPKTRPSSEQRGAYAFEPVLTSPKDLEKLRVPRLTLDEEATKKSLATMQELFGDILNVERRGVAHIGYHLTAQYCKLRGPENMLYDMYERPGMIHDFMQVITEGHLTMRRWYEENNLLSLNNDNTYNTSGGSGYTDQLPAPGFDPARVRPCDMWSSSEAQEMAAVSPEMHYEFVMQYEKRLLEPFGLTGYGCCEDLTLKLDQVFTLPGIRRISISPWANVDICAEKLKGNHIFSWKPQPAHLCGDFNPSFIREYLRHTIEVCRDNGCVLEMILKDTHTCESHPERFDEWSRIARELTDEYAEGWPVHRSGA